MRNSPNDIAIQLTNVSKKYEIHHEKPTLVEKFVKGNPPADGETKRFGATGYKFDDQ